MLQDWYFLLVKEHAPPIIACAQPHTYCFSGWIQSLYSLEGISLRLEPELP